MYCDRTPPAPPTGCWQGAGPMNECNACGAAVTPSFARVFGDNQNEVFGCMHCRSMSELQQGYGGVPA